MLKCFATLLELGTLLQEGSNSYRYRFCYSLSDINEKSQFTKEIGAARNALETIKYGDRKDLLDDRS